MEVLIKSMMVKDKFIQKFLTKIQVYGARKGVKFKNKLQTAYPTGGKKNFAQRLQIYDEWAFRLYKPFIVSIKT